MVRSRSLRSMGLVRKVEGAAVHRFADVSHIAVRRHDDHADQRVDLGDVAEQRQAIHRRHVDIRQHDIDVGIAGQLLNGHQPVFREQELVLSAANLQAKALADQHRYIGLVIHDQHLDAALSDIAQRRKCAGHLARRLIAAAGSAARAFSKKASTAGPSSGTCREGGRMGYPGLPRRTMISLTLPPITGCCPVSER